ncbi:MULTISPECIES: fused uroporphyrinogen-III synthase HemD/membrane protein HemX [Methylococcus]|uniref:Fused uroporphyrinogen-III synthase HemD/membrane protein HemX n=1 Tax=Methylococcus capsulatus TaxID=414 RepID=A0ABZ2F712_METCP|nr:MULTISPECIES: fused uroporphyrinogen-III synthase HemD/membrane protein HemX [Methylococcus]
MSRSLSGMRVLITRPKDQAEPLCKLVEAAGGSVIRFPLLEIEPSARAEEGAALLRQASDWDWWIFVSANAVNQARALGVLRPDGARPRIAAIGKATADALVEGGITVDLVPGSQANSEGLLETPAMQDVAGRRILIVRGEGGRETLKERLVERGALVQYAELYRRVPVHTGAEALIDSLRTAGLDILTATSGEAIEHLYRLIPPEERPRLLETPLVVISERLKNQAGTLGFRHVMVADTASDAAVLEALKDAAAHRASLRTAPNDGDKPLAEERKQMTEAPQPQASGETPRDPHGNAAPAPAHPPRRSRVVAWLGYSMLAAILLLATAGFFLIQELRSKQEGLGGELNKGDLHLLELSRQVSSLQTQLATLHSQFATLQSQLGTEDSKLERLLGEQSASFSQKLEDTRKELAQAIQAIQRQLNRTHADVLIADAEYLLSIANQKLHLSGDVKSVLEAMQAADQRLHDSGDPSVFKVREVLAEEINRLEDFQPPDVVGLSARLLAIEAKTRELPLFLPHPDMSKEPRETPKPKSPEPETGNAVGSTLEQLKGLVTVRRSDRPVHAVLTPQEAAGLREILLLKLEMTRTALLRGDDALFHSNLESASDWLNENFDHESAAFKDISADLRAMTGVRLNASFPDIGGSLALLRNIEKLRLETDAIAPASTAAPATPSGSEAPGGQP